VNTRYKSATRARIRKSRRIPVVNDRREGDELRLFFFKGAPDRFLYAAGWGPDAPGIARRWASHPKKGDFYFVRIHDALNPKLPLEVREQLAEIYHHIVHPGNDVDGPR
ncbi:hypothetical protein LCGC14_2747440, partial [marine sediment metagenome]